MAEPIIAEDREIHVKPEVVTGRDYSIYTRAMDAAVAAKFSSMWRLVGEISDDAIIADIGSGTGAFAELVAKTLRESHPTVLAVDRSHELIEYAADRFLINLVFDEATSLANLPDNSVDVMMHGTIGHEIYSQSGGEGLRQALAAARRSLKPGGKEVWRDMVKPTYTGNVFMRIDVADGVDTVEEATSNGFLDYSKLSTRALFDRFHEEFLGGQAFRYQSQTIDGREYIELPAEFAHEFMLRKDYTANWRAEIKEKYTYWTLAEAKLSLEEAGFVNVEVVADDSAWIRENRLRGKVAVFMRDEKGDLREVEFPTHMVIAADKPGVATEGQVTIAQIDYGKILAAIDIDESQGSVTIGDKKLAIGPFIGQGSHKRVYKNAADGGKTVVKVVRQDEPDVHNVFKSMLQAIDRQPILSEYKVPHMKIVDYDREGPPYRYLIQEVLPENAVSAAVLIRDGQFAEFAERDIAQIAGIVNRFEEGKRWQLDMSPYNWYRVVRPDGSTQMVYTGSTVYAYDERWTFGRIGVPQWSDAKFVPETVQQSAVIPRRSDVERFLQTLETTDNPTAGWFRKYLSPTVFPPRL